MYSGWVSSTEAIQADPADANVLRTYPNNVGREVVQSVLRPLCEQVENQFDESSNLTTSEQVEWTMQVVGYGFSLPLQDKAVIGQCITVYESWLTALSADKSWIPAPIRADPNRYAQIIFGQVCELFVPRTRLSEEIYLEDQVLLCKKVTKIIQSIVRNKSVSLSRDSWSSLFHCLLQVSDTLLSPPANSAASLGSLLCEDLVSVLFDAWLRACVDCFPTPNLWKSLRELCCKWRHHHSLVEQWSKLMYALTYHVISLLYTPKYLLGLSNLPEQEPYHRQVLTDMPNNALIQCWFRMLHTLGNPVELAYPSKIASLPAFQKALAEAEKQPQRPSLSAHCFSGLPAIFLEAMRGVATLAYLFIAQELPKDQPLPVESLPSTPHPSPGARRRDSREGRTGLVLPHVPSSSKSKTATKWYVHTPTFPHQPSPASQSTQGLIAGLIGEVGRPRGNTLLHLLGSWLFEAAIWPLHSLPADAGEESRAGPGAMLMELAVHTECVLNPWDFEAGRAEAFGALCSIFSSQPCGEPFLATYLARFYHAMAVGLHYDPKTCRGQALIKIVLNSRGLLRKDLPGVNMLVPMFLSALEIILPCDVLPFECPVDVTELRRASIQLLLSITPLPLHFLQEQLPDLRPIIPELSTPSPPTFFSLRDRLLSLLFSALQHERDPANVQALLHGLLVFIQDIVTYENAVTRMLESEEVDGEEVEGLHPPLTSTRSDASSQSHTHAVSKSFDPPELLSRSIAAAHHCLKDWEGTVQVSLAALELMTGLAQLRIENASHTDYRQAVLWVCEYINHQALKERPQHSRDLHTSIVAAFNTLTVWITAYYPYLLGTERCLTAIMKVAELGISGSFSTSEDGGTIYKGDKPLKPISGRVKETAEFVLATVLERIGSFPSPCGAEASSSLLSEEDILTWLPPSRKDSAQFRYFVVDNSLVVGFLEEPFTDEEDSLPTLTAVLRGPTGRHVWSMQLRHQPRSEQPSTQHLHSMTRPPPNPHTPTLPSLTRRPWPREVDTEPRMKVDESIPQLSDIVRESTHPSHHLMAQLTTQQVEAESSVHHELQAALSQLPFPDPSSAVEPPLVKSRFETARLFLSHLGLLGLESIKFHTLAQVSPLAMLDSSPPNFRSTLASLDRMPTQFCNTVFVLHLGQGMSQPRDILSHQQSLSSKPPEFIEFLNGLGWIVDPLTHPGFLGKIRPRKADDAISQAVGIQAEKPLRPLPYYADAMTEVAFVSPTLKSSGSESSASLRSGGSSDSAQELTSSVTGEHTPSLPTYHSMQTLREPQGSGVCESAVQADGDKYTTLPTIGRANTFSRAETGVDTPRKRVPAPADCAAMVVWLERFEDHSLFPVERMTAILHGGSFTGVGSHKTGTKKALPTVFIHRLSSGLYQIVTRSSAGRQEASAGPLIDGMVVSRRSLSGLVRQTTINMCSRHRMENEGYSPPHVQRKRKVEEISKEFAKRISVAEFYSELFAHTSK